MVYIGREILGGNNLVYFGFLKETKKNWRPIIVSMGVAHYQQNVWANILYSASSQRNLCIYIYLKITLGMKCLKFLVPSVSRGVNWGEAHYSWRHLGLGSAVALHGAELFTWTEFIH